MDTIENSSLDEIESIDRAYAARSKELTTTQRAVVDHKALGGIVVDEQTGEHRKMTMGELAGICGVTEDALFKARKSLPNYWELVNERRIELGSQERLGKFHNTWYLKALEMKNWPLAEAWIRNFDPNYKSATFKMEHEAGQSMVDLFTQLQAETQPSRHLIEAETLPHETSPTADNSPV